MKRFLMLSVTVGVVAVPRLDAQRFEVGAGAAMVQNHLRFAASTNEQSGQWIGGDAAMRFGSLRLVLAGSIGSLDGSADGLVPDRQGRATSLALQFAPRPWLAAGVQVEAKRFDTNLGATVWRLIGASATLTPSLGGPVQGLVDVTLWPMAGVVNGEAISLAMRSVFGATYWISPRFGARLAYRFERFDFDGQGGVAGEERLEQFRGATVGAVFRVP